MKEIAGVVFSVLTGRDAEGFLFAAAKKTGNGILGCITQTDEREELGMGKNKINEKGIPYGARQKMPFWYSLAWSSRGIAAGLNVVLIAYVSFYCTDILGLSAGIVGTMLLASKVVDAFTDLWFGYFLDKTHTRFGKARPYEVFIIFEWIFTVMMFNVPDGSKTFQYVWVFIMYVLINAVCATALNGVDSVYMARTFTTDNNRIKAMTINGVLVMFACIIFNIVAPQAINTIGTTKPGWFKITLVMAVPLVLIGILRFFLCKEVVTDNADEESAAKEPKLSMGEMLKAVSKNKYAFIVVGMMFITFIVNNMNNATTYYFKYIMGDIGLMSVAMATSMITPVAMMLFPVLSRKLGTTKILQACCVIGIAGMAIRTICGANMAAIVVGTLLFGLGTMPISMMINTYLIDCMDYGEWKTGIRVEGLIASIANFASKLGQGVAAGLIGIVMGMAGYDGTLEVQSASANAAIVGLYNWLPLVLFIVMFILAAMYKMDEIRPQMKADLEARHQAKGN